MTIKRYYVGSEIELKHDFWVHDDKFLDRWRAELQVGEDLVLFDGAREDRLYKLLEITDREAHLRYVTDYARKLPAKELYLVWPLFGEVQAEAIVKFASNYGVSHFIPYYDDKDVPERPSVDAEYLKSLVITEIEQGDRSDMPVVRDPMTLEAVFDELNEKADFVVCDYKDSELAPTLADDKSLVLLVPPKDGWKSVETDLFTRNRVTYRSISGDDNSVETTVKSVLQQLLPVIFS